VASTGDSEREAEPPAKHRGRSDAGCASPSPSPTGLPTKAPRRDDELGRSFRCKKGDRSDTALGLSRCPPAHRRPDGHVQRDPGRHRTHRDHVARSSRGAARSSARCESTPERTLPPTRVGSSGQQIPSAAQIHGNPRKSIGHGERLGGPWTKAFVLQAFSRTAVAEVFALHERSLARNQARRSQDAYSGGLWIAAVSRLLQEPVGQPG
jgi:hypothetical protein